MLKIQGLRWLWVSVIVIILDRVTKFFAQKDLIPYDALPVFPSFNLRLAYNKGAAFSFLNEASGWQTWVFGGIAIIVCIAVLFWMRKLTREQHWLGVALALIIGGALGNLWDRILFGHVIDFIELYISQYHWPVFNVADSAICIGAVMLLWDAMVSKKS